MTSYTAHRENGYARRPKKPAVMSRPILDRAREGRVNRFVNIRGKRPVKGLFAFLEEENMGQSTQDLDRLQQKYQPVLSLMKQLDVRLQNLNMQGNQLLIRGIAPSEDAKNRVWNQVKLIDSSYSDLICDISVSQQQAPATMTAGASVSGGQSQRHYTVQSGDTLSKISRQFYGDGSQFMKIFNANRNILDDPNRISPGQDLVIPD
jgi:LysM repeat protein